MNRLKNEKKPNLDSASAGITFVVDTSFGEICLKDNSIHERGTFVG